MLVKLNGVPAFFRQTATYNGLDSVHTTPHHGIDLATYMHTPLPSVSNGVVENVWHLGNVNVGNGIKVLNDNGQEVIYGHLSDINVHVGDKVHIGQIIGHTGNSGHSTGPHLHIGAKADGHFIDPQHYVDILQSIAHHVLDAGWATVQCIIHFI